MANNTDRLFREGLDQYEVTPQAQSWQEVQNRLAKKKRVAWLPMSVAAAIILLITATLLMRNDQMDQSLGGPAISAIDFPQPTFNQGEIIIPENEVKAPAMQKATPPVFNNKVMFAGNTSKQEESADELKKVEIATLQLVAIEEVRLQELPQPKFNYDFEVLTVEKPTIKITYIAENEPAEKKNKLNSIISSISKDASPIEILADIRDAKDNIFSRN